MGGHVDQFVPARCIGFGCRQRVESLGVALGPQDQRLGGDVHGPQLFLPVQGLRVAEKIETRQMRGDLKAHIGHPQPIDFVTARGVARRALLLEFGEDAGLVGRDPFIGHVGEYLLAHRAALPEGDDFLGVEPPGFVIDGVGDLGPRIEDLKVFKRVQADLGIGRRLLGRRAALGDDQFVVSDPNVLVAQDMLEGQGPLDRHRFSPGGAALIEIGEQQRPFDRNLGSGFQTAGSQTFDAGGHVPPPTVTVRPAPANRSHSASYALGARLRAPAILFSSLSRRYLPSAME